VTDDKKSDWADARSGKETAIKAALDLIPYAGGAIATIYDDHMERRRERAKTTVAEAVDWLNGDEERLVTRLRNDEEFADLFFGALRAAAATSIEAKRRVLARALAEGVEEGEGELDEIKLLVAAVEGLELIHFRTLKRIESFASTGQLESLIAATPVPVFASLISYGLVEESDGYNGPQVLGLTDFGERVLHFVQDAGGIPPE
jgi:hypothetical protein